MIRLPWQIQARDEFFQHQEHVYFKSNNNSNKIKREVLYKKYHKIPVIFVDVLFKAIVTCNISKKGMLDIFLAKIFC